MEKYLLKMCNGGSVVAIKAIDFKSIITQGSRIYGTGFIRRCNVFRVDSDYLTWINRESVEEEAAGIERPKIRACWNEERDDLVYDDCDRDTVLWEKAERYVAELMEGSTFYTLHILVLEKAVYCAFKASVRNTCSRCALEDVPHLYIQLVDFVVSLRVF